MSTPVQRQYFELKSQNPGAILFFHLGDFYEMFFEDAQLCSRVLGIALTARHRGTENEMPMCGFPRHAASEYIEKLVSAGYRVAIAEQNEDPETKKITREIVRVVTPGTTLESGNLEPEKNSFIAAISKSKNEWALAYADISTGNFRTASFAREIDFFDELYKINPREILISSDLFSEEKFCSRLPKVLITPRKRLVESRAESLLLNNFGVQSLSIFGLEKISLLIEVSALVIDYLAETQKTKLSHIQKIVRYSTDDIMRLDAQTFRHLEIFEPLIREDGAATLVSVFEKTKTAMGGRLLREWVANPLLSPEKINERLEAVSEICTQLELQKKLSENLKKICDLERVFSRVAMGRGNARDFVFLRTSLSVLPEIAAALRNANVPALVEKAQMLTGFSDLNKILDQALVDDPPLEITAGGMFRDGFSASLDELRSLKGSADAWLEKFLERKKSESGISTLKVKFSNNFGFCLEVSQGNIPKVPASWIRRQTLVNAERYTTDELAEYEKKVLSSEAQAFQLEHELFLKLREQVLEKSQEIFAASKVVAELDALLTFALTAQKWRWTKPAILPHSSAFRVIEGRHPVVEKILESPFIANDLLMDERSRFHLITGPNMAGKSTFLRQNALIVLLAQIGCFVPAKKCEMGIVDRIFTRVGASDNLSAGKSTFFVEMSETAAILNSATDQSFVILDEIGRGTSTFDGISLAWAITEFLHDKIKAKTIFATHFHELIDCTESLPHAQNFHVSVSQSGEGIIFLRKILPGGISDSFGIEVAKLAGLPKDLVARSREILSRLESESLLPEQPNLFSQPRVSEKVVEISKKSEVEKTLEGIDPENLSPREALERLFELKRVSNKKDSSM